MKVDWNKRYVIWIRTAKVASTSIYCVFGHVLLPMPFWEYTERGDLSKIPKYGKIIEVQSIYHGFAMGIEEFKEKYPDVWKNAFKVLAIRNPYDRFVSGWKFLGNRIPFDDMISIIDNYSGMLPFDRYHLTTPLTEGLIDDGELNVDFIIRYENLQEDFDKFCDIISYPRAKLPHEKRGYHGNYKKYYNQERADYIYNLMKNDFHYLNYDKDSWK